MNAIDVPVQALGWALLHFVWQGALVGAIAGALLWQLKHARPQSRYAVACLALLACVLLPLATLLDGTLAPASAEPVAAALVAPAGDATAAVALAGDSATVRAFPGVADVRAFVQSRLPAIVALWAIGAAMLALRMCLGLAWVARVGGLGHGHAHWQARLDALAQRLKLPRRVLLRVVDGLESPVVVRALRPVVLVPATLLTRMPADLLEALLAHELAHVRRHDYLINLIQGAVEALLFYHPVVWWLSKRIRVERELIADDVAADAIGDRRRVARALDALSTLQSSPATVPNLALAADGGLLVSRIQHLVRPRRPSVQWRAALPVIGISVLCLSFAQAQQDVPAPAPGSRPVLETVLATPATAPAASPRAVVEPATAAAESAAAPAIEARDASVVEPGAEDDANTWHTRGTIVVADDDDGRDAYALLAADDADGIAYVDVNLESLERLKAMRARIDGEFLWVRRDGREYVVDDPQLLATVRAAWNTTEPVSRKMEALGAEMEKHGEVMEEIGRRMEAQADVGQADARAMEKLGEQMSAVGAEHAELAARHVRLSHTAAYADTEAEREKAEADLEAMEDDMERVQERMDALSEQMDAHGDALDRAHAPLDAMSAEMDRASAPMDALGEQMDALGEEMDRLSERAEQVTRDAIDRAARDGKLVPVDRAAAR